MIYTRFGGEATVLRYPTRKDVETMDPPLDNEALVNLQVKSWVVADIGNGPQIVKVADLRADEGWSEIGATLKTWECPDCGESWPSDERCHNDKCHKTQQRRMKQWREKQAKAYA